LSQRCTHISLSSRIFRKSRSIVAQIGDSSPKLTAIWERSYHLQKSRRKCRWRKFTSVSSSCQSLKARNYNMPIAEDKVREALKSVVDPELFVNIVDLGLIYEVKIDEVPE